MTKLIIRTLSRCEDAAGLDEQRDDQCCHRNYFLVTSRHPPTTTDAEKTTKVDRQYGILRQGKCKCSGYRAVGAAEASDGRCGKYRQHYRKPYAWSQLCL